MWFKKDTNQQKPIKRKANGLDYLEIQGEPGGKTILLLHGFGADSNDLVTLNRAYQGTSLQPTWIFPNGPVKVSLGFGFSGRSWFEIDLDLLQNAFRQQDYESVQDAFPEEISEIRKQLEGFLAEINISPENLVLGGFSQGAVLATDLALHSFARPLGLLVFSGTIVHRDLWKRLASQKGSLPFFQTHGIRDPILPFVLAQQLESLFLESGLKGKLHPFEGGHTIDASLMPKLTSFLTSIL